MPLIRTRLSILLMCGLQACGNDSSEHSQKSDNQAARNEELRLAATARSEKQQAQETQALVTSQLAAAAQAANEKRWQKALGILHKVSEQDGVSDEQREEVEGHIQSTERRAIHEVKNKDIKWAILCDLLRDRRGSILEFRVQNKIPFAPDGLESLEPLFQRAAHRFIALAKEQENEAFESKHGWAMRGWYCRLPGTLPSFLSVSSAGSVVSYSQWHVGKSQRSLSFQGESDESGFISGLWTQPLKNGEIEFISNVWDHPFLNRYRLRKGSDAGTATLIPLNLDRGRNEAPELECQDHDLFYKDYDWNNPPPQ